MWMNLLIGFPIGVSWFEYSKAKSYAVVELLCRYYIYCHTNQIVPGNVLDAIFVREDGSLCIFMPESSNAEYSEEKFERDVDFLWRFMFVAANGYDLSCISDIHLIYSEKGFNSDVPDFYKKFCEHVRTKSYKKYNISASLNPLYFGVATKQIEQLAKLRDYLDGCVSHKGFFNIKFGLWKPDLMKRKPSECKLRQFYDKNLKALARQKASKARGRKIYGIPAANYKEYSDVLRLLRDAIEHLSKALRLAKKLEDEEILELFNKSLNLCWRVFQACLDVSIMGTVTAVDFLKAVGLYAP